MSEYAEAKTKMKDRTALVEALVEMGWKREDIEICDEAKHLEGYHGDKRPEKANVIIRRQFVGTSSNDIGFVKTKDGTYEAIISAYDRSSGGRHAKHTRGYNETWLKELNQKYIERRCIRKAKEKGVDVRKTMDGKKIVLTIVDYK